MTGPGGERLLNTPRLTLRPLGAADAAVVARLAADFDVCRMTTRMPFPYAETDAQAFVAAVHAQDHGRERVFAIERTGEGLVGVLGFHQDTHGRLEMGYWLGRPFWGQGYATEAARAAMSWAGADWGKRTAIAGHFIDNPASGQVLVKAGFLYTGVVEHRFSRARGAIAPTRMMVWLA